VHDDMGVHDDLPSSDSASHSRRPGGVGETSAKVRGRSGIRGLKFVDVKRWPSYYE
jgi:hypothetical protein